ncbi:MAG: hypothetical protein PWQ25_530 [Deferribacteres bacterium]|jgi:hypothetical protein|nr:hypothetical protein [Deferribacteraceae bacterium]MDK2791667.1 hypothetical protein [Deferribacteres bacterium]
MKKIIFVTLATFFAMSAFGEDVHVIKKGDTLWDISGKYYKDNFKWPIIWKYNTYINDPDLIFPKDKVTIPLIVNDGEILKLDDEASFKIGNKEASVQQASMDENVKESTVQPSVSYKTIKLSDYEIVEKSLPAEKVIATQEGKYFVSDGDVLRISIKSEKFSVGQEVTFLRYIKELKDGQLLKIAGYGAVESIEKDNALVRVKKSYESLSKGLFARAKKNEDELKISDNYVDVRTNRTGKVVYLSQSMSISGNGYRLVFDKGLKDGIKAGDIVEVIRAGNDGGYYREIKVGEAMVIYSSDSYSTANILSSKLEISNGDEVRLVKVAAY